MLLFRSMAYRAAIPSCSKSALRLAERIESAPSSQRLHSPCPRSQHGAPKSRELRSMKACPAAGANLTFELWLNLRLESLEASHPKRSQRQVWHDVIFCLAGFLMPLAAIQQDSRSFVTEAAARVHKTACLLSFVHSRQAYASVPDFWCPSTCVPIRSLNSWSLIYS